MRYAPTHWQACSRETYSKELVQTSCLTMNSTPEQNVTTANCDTPVVVSKIAGKKQKRNELQGRCMPNKRPKNEEKAVSLVQLRKENEELREQIKETKKELILLADIWFTALGVRFTMLELVEYVGCKPVVSRL